MSGSRWQKLRLRGSGKDATSVAVEDWQDVLASGSTVGTPQLQAVFNNGWATASGFSTANKVQYYKDPFGIVRLKGTAARTPSIPQMTLNETLLTLPFGYRPNQELRFACVNNLNTDALTVVLSVLETGEIKWRGDNTGAVVPSFYYVAAGTGYTSDLRQSFDGIAFRAEEKIS